MVSLSENALSLPPFLKERPFQRTSLFLSPFFTGRQFFVVSFSESPFFWSPFQKTSPFLWSSFQRVLFGGTLSENAVFWSRVERTLLSENATYNCPLGPAAACQKAPTQGYHPIGSRAGAPCQAEAARSPEADVVGLGASIARSSAPGPPAPVETCWVDASRRVEAIGGRGS